MFPTPFCVLLLCFAYTSALLIFFIDVSPIQRPATNLYLPTQLITLGQVPQPDIENDFTAQNTPLTPSHVPYGTPTHTPSPCNTPCKFGTSSPISKPLKVNCTTEYEAEQDVGQASKSPMATTTPDTCYMCGQRCSTNALKANSVLLSVTSTQSLPVNASSLRGQIERVCQSEQSPYAEAETSHLDELENGFPVDVSPIESLSELEVCVCVCVHVYGHTCVQEGCACLCVCCAYVSTCLLVCYVIINIKFTETMLTEHLIILLVSTYTYLVIINFSSLVSYVTTYTCR